MGFQTWNLKHKGQCNNKSIDVTVNLNFFSTILTNFWQKTEKSVNNDFLINCTTMPQISGIDTCREELYLKHETHSVKMRGYVAHTVN